MTVQRKQVVIQNGRTDFVLEQSVSLVLHFYTVLMEKSV